MSRARLPAALALVLAALAFVGPAAASPATPILGTTNVTAHEAQAWAAGHGATPRFRALARLYWHLAPDRRVRPDVAYAQAAKETGFGRFGGVLDASFRNPCGMKKSAGGGNYDPSAHARFPSWSAGVAAHLDHLALYAGVPGYPRSSSPDPRHFPFLRGTARSVEALGAAWAPAPDYGRSIVGLLASLERAAAAKRPVTAAAPKAKQAEPSPKPKAGTQRSAPATDRPEPAPEADHGRNWPFEPGWIHERSPFLAPPGSLTWSWPKPAGGGPGAPAGSPALGPEAP